ncbi:MAG: ATP-binding protein [Butyrivibrio sp.]|nr:ATP-binding protein [Butyrivibrio sp.]
MFKKTKVRSILELLGKNLSAREVSKVLGVSRNTVAEVQALFLQSGRSWDDISDWDDDRLYGLFYPDKFKYKPRYAPVDYAYVHVEACRQTYRVLYIRMPDLMRNFENQSDNLRELTKYRKRIGNYQILILDEWHSRLGGGAQADSIMDRIIHNAYEIPANETNLRKLYDSRKLKKLVDGIEA